MPSLSSSSGAFGYGRPVSRTPYKYYRWQITASKTDPPEGNCVQASEFVFQINGVDQQTITSSASVSNPNGNNPAGETPIKLTDSNLTTKFLDLNFVSNSRITNFIFTFPSPYAFTGYRWATANDAESRDPKNWNVSGSSDGTNWVTLSAVSNFTATSTRNTYNSTTWTY